MEDYKPNHIGKGIDKHVWITGLFYVVAVVVFWGAAYWLLSQMEWLSPNDKTLMHRWLTERSIRVIFCDTALLGLVCFIQVFTNGNLLKRILQDSRACAYVLSALLLANALLLIGG